MRTPRLYINQHLEENTSIQLSKSESHYLATVLRMKAGRQVLVFNGQSDGEFVGEIIELNKKGVRIALQEFTLKAVESQLLVELGVALIKHDRMDWLVQKATELGVTAITPLLTEYTDTKLPSDRQEKKIQHWQQIAIHACEQSGRTNVPVVNTPSPLKTWLENADTDLKLVLHPYHSSPLTQELAAQSVSVLVGPEGGLTEDEVAMALDNGFKAISLGKRILRAETAPLTLISILQYQLGDLS